MSFTPSCRLSIFKFSPGFLPGPSVGAVAGYPHAEGDLIVSVSALLVQEALPVSSQVNGWPVSLPEPGPSKIPPQPGQSPRKQQRAVAGGEKAPGPGQTGKE